MAERIRVDEATLRELWFSDDGDGLIHDYQTGTKVVRMKDGTEYETPFDEITRIVPSERKPEESQTEHTWRLREHEERERGRGA